MQNAANILKLADESYITDELIFIRAQLLE